MFRENCPKQNQWRNRFYLPGSGESSEQSLSGVENGISVSLIRPAGEERMSRRKWSLLIGLIGSVIFNVGWWISYPPMVFAGVLLAAAGLDLWIER